MAIRSRYLHVAVTAAVLLLGCVGCKKDSPRDKDWQHTIGKPVKLPDSDKAAGLPLNDALATRRSQREFSSESLTDEQISQLCWAAQGISDARGKRTAPSAGGLYPITLVLADGRGVWEYLPHSHALASHGKDDVREEIQAAALNQSAVGDAPACFVITFDVGRTAKKYGEHAERYCLLEAGHVAQNILLTATSLNLAGVPIGAFHEDEIAEVLGLPASLEPVYLIPIGSAIK